MPQIPIEIQKFLENLLEDAGIKNLTPQLKTDMLKNLTGRLQQSFLITVTKYLEPEDVDGLHKLEEQGASQEEIQYFLGQRIPNLSKITAQAMLDFKKSFLEGVKLT